MGDGLLYHHGCELAHVRHDIIVPWRFTQAVPEPACRQRGACTHTDRWHDALHFEACYRWLAQQVGFWPLWLAVGDTDEDRRMTGYQNQWRRGNVPWADGHEPENQVLFSWHDEPARGLRYVCYEHWYIVLNSVHYAGENAPRPSSEHRAEVLGMTSQLQSWVLHHARERADWLRQARREPHTVQAVTPLLDLRAADEVCCRNRSTREALLRLGFAPAQVRVRRLRV